MPKASDNADLFIKALEDPKVKKELSDAIGAYTHWVMYEDQYALARQDFWRHVKSRENERRPPND